MKGVYKVIVFTMQTKIIMVLVITIIPQFVFLITPSQTHTEL